MIEELLVKELALVERADVRFSAGLNWSWESGGNCILWGLVRGADSPYGYGGDSYGFPSYGSSPQSGYGGYASGQDSYYSGQQSGYTAPEIVWRLHGTPTHHVGFIVRSATPERVETLLDELEPRIVEDFATSLPPPAAPTA